MAILHFLSYGAALAAFLFVTLSVASGLLWISELIEEHSKLAKSVGIRGIYVIIAIHFVLYFTDGLPLAKTLFSVFCHIVYLQNFSNTWPVISLTSLTFIASCILVIADHFLWFFHFAAATQQARHNSMGRIRGVRGPSFGDMSTFFAICVWLAPLFLFLSLSANDNALPTNAGIPASPTQVSHFADLRAPAQPRTSLFRSLLLPLNYLPRLRGKQPRNEGIIAPPSPVPSRPSSPLHMTATLNNLPPTSPRPASFDGQSHLTPDFRLRPPVRRGASSDDTTPPPPSTEAYKMR